MATSEPTPLHKILDDDQHDARATAWKREARMVAGATAEHYQTLRAAELPPGAAKELTVDFQNMLMYLKVEQTFDGAVFEGGQ